MTISLDDLKTIFTRGYQGKAPYSGAGDLNPDVIPFFIPPTKKSAFLIPIIERDGGLHILLTKRSETVAKNPGMVVFPGGKADEEDTDLAQTALREASEEIGITSNDVKILGEMPPYQAAYGFYMTPVIGILAPPSKYVLDEVEVGSVHEVPLEFFLEEQNIERDEIVFTDSQDNPHTLKTYAYDYKGLKITYNTAGFLVGLKHILEKAYGR